MGAEKFDRLLEWCDELAIPIVTVWALSLDNLYRDPKELDQLIEVIQHKLKDLALTASPGLSARSVHVVGRLDALPDHVREAIADVETRTAQVGPFRLNIAVGYDGREEITEAVRNLLLERADQEISLKDVAKELTPEDITQRLYSKGEPDPDLIIRTSGELRLGGFMLWQSVHSMNYSSATLYGQRFARWTFFELCEATSNVIGDSENELHFEFGSIQLIYGFE